MSFLSRAFRPETRAADFSNSARIPSPLEDAMIHQDGGGAMSLAAFFACVRIMADNVASLPLNAYRQSGDVSVLVSPQPKLLQGGSPYPGMTMFTWLWMMMESLATSGNAFGYITSRGDDGRPTAILPIPQDTVQIDVTSGDASWINPIYRFGGQKVSSADVVHIQRYPKAGRAAGLSPVQELASTIGLSLAANRYGLQYFKDAANPSGILSSDQDLSREQVEQAQKNWIISHQGRRLPAIMGGGLKWESISITPEESQFLLTRSFQRTEIAMIFGIPPHMLGDIEKQTSFGAGVEQQSIGFTTYTLRAWLACIEQALEMLIPRGQSLKFNIDGLLRGDVKARWEAHQIAIQSGAKSPNEVRVKEDLPPFEGGDIHIQPMNFVKWGTPPSAYKSSASGEKGQS